MYVYVYTKIYSQQRYLVHTYLQKKSHEWRVFECIGFNSRNLPKFLLGISYQINLKIVTKK